MNQITFAHFDIIYIFSAVIGEVEPKHTRCHMTIIDLSIIFVAILIVCFVWFQLVKILNKYWKDSGSIELDKEPFKENTLKSQNKSMTYKVTEWPTCKKIISIFLAYMWNLKIVITERSRVIDDSRTSWDIMRSEIWVILSLR